MTPPGLTALAVTLRLRVFASVPVLRGSTHQYVTLYTSLKQMSPKRKA